MSKLNNSQIPDTLSSKTIDNSNSIDTTTTNLSISGGSSGQVLSTDGSGNLSWATAGGGGGSYPTSETISSGAIDTSKTISYITGNVTLGSATKGDIKYIINANTNNSFKYVTDIITGGNVNSLIIDSSGKVIVFGVFSNINNVSGTNKIAIYDPIAGTYSSLGGGVISGNEIYKAKIDHLGRIWVVGDFTNIGGTTCSNIAYWNGSTWTAGNVGTINGQVRQIIFDSSNLGNYWICGGFTTANGVTVNRFAYFNGTTYVGYGTGIADNFAFEMMRDSISGNIYITGGFSSVNSITNTTRIVRFNPTTNVYSSVGISNYVNGGFAGFGLYAENDIVYLGGGGGFPPALTTTNGLTSPFLYFDGTNWTTTKNRPGSTIRSIRKLNGEIYVIGENSNTNVNLSSSLLTSNFFLSMQMMKFDIVKNYLQPFTNTTISQNFDIVYNSSNQKYYVGNVGGLSEINSSNIVQISCSGSTKFKVPTGSGSSNSYKILDNLVGCQLYQNGTGLEMIYDGQDWNVINGNLALSTGYYFTTEKFI